MVVGALVLIIGGVFVVKDLVIPFGRQLYVRNFGDPAAEKEFRTEFTNADQVVVVMVSGAYGDPKEVERYLLSKFSAATSHDYDASYSEAILKTNEARQRAADTALANARAQGRGPGLVRYNYDSYKPVLPRPKTKLVALGFGNFQIFGAPVIDLGTFTSNVPILKAPATKGRRIWGSVTLPTPIPTLIEEMFWSRHGQANVARLIIEDSYVPNVEKPLVKLLQTALGNPQLECGPIEVFIDKGQRVGLGMQIGPVPDLKALADRMTFGTVLRMGGDHRDVVVKLDLSKIDIPKSAAESPTFATKTDSLPTDRESIEERIKAARERMNIPEPKRELDDSKPAQDEHILDWAIRALGGTWNVEKAIDELSIQPVDEAYRTKVSAALVNALDKTNTFRLKKILTAMLKWRTAETAPAIISYYNKNGWSSTRSELLDALVELKTHECAEVVAALYDKSFRSSEAGPYLKKMGPVAEEACHKYLEHMKDEVRYSVYEVLAEIGTEKSVTKLRNNQNRERAANMKLAAKQAIDAIRKRHPVGTNAATKDK